MPPDIISIPPLPQHRYLLILLGLLVMPCYAILFVLDVVGSGQTIHPLLSHDFAQSSPRCRAKLWCFVQIGFFWELHELDLQLGCWFSAGCLWEIVLVGGAHKLIVLAWSFMGTVSFYWLCFSLGMIHMYLSIIYTTTLVMIYFVWEWNYLRWDRFLVHIKYNMCAGAVRHELRSTNKTDNRHCRIKLGRKPASHSKRTPQ